MFVFKRYSALLSPEAILLKWERSVSSHARVILAWATRTFILTSHVLLQQAWRLWSSSFRALGLVCRRRESGDKALCSLLYCFRWIDLILTLNKKKKLPFKESIPDQTLCTCLLPGFKSLHAIAPYPKSSRSLLKFDSGSEAALNQRAVWFTLYSSWLSLAWFNAFK